MDAKNHLGAGAGVGLLRLIGKRLRKEAVDPPLTRHELPYTLAMIALDILAPILLIAALFAYVVRIRRE